MLERATAADPGSADLWNALGEAYLTHAATAGKRGDQDRAALRANFERASSAYERALQLDPRDARALGGHGMTLVVLASFARRADWVTRGLAEMARAVALEPNDVRVRLARAFTEVNLPPAMRDTPAIQDDFAFLLQRTDGTRPGDVLRILRGDLFAESGAAGSARRDYLAADRAGSSSQAQSRARLIALDRDEPPRAAIAELRSRLASDCMMCHAD